MFELPGFRFESVGQDEGRVYEPVQIILLDFVERLKSIRNMGPKRLEGRGPTPVKLQWAHRLHFLAKRDFGRAVANLCKVGFCLRFTYDGRIFTCLVRLPGELVASLGEDFEQELANATRSFNWALAKVQKSEEEDLAKWGFVRIKSENETEPELEPELKTEADQDDDAGVEEPFLGFEVSQTGDVSELGDAQRILKVLFAVAWKRAQSKTIPDMWEWVLEWTHISDEVLENRDNGKAEVREIVIAEHRLEFLVDDVTGLHSCSVVLPPSGFTRSAKDLVRELSGFFPRAKFVNDCVEGLEKQTPEALLDSNTSDYQDLVSELGESANIDGDIEVNEVKSTIRRSMAANGKRCSSKEIDEIVERLVASQVLEVVYMPEESDMKDLTIYRVRIEETSAVR